MSGPSHISPGDKVLEIGARSGYICLLGRSQVDLLISSVRVEGWRKRSGFDDYLD
jgi:protein-L-isoaspartate O-methyltransferase